MSKEHAAFEALLNKFYENGLLREVYRTERAIICNVFNQYYIAFSLDILEHYTEDFPGFKVLNSIGLLETVKDDNWVNKYYGYLTADQKKKVLMFLNEDFYAELMEHKAELSQLSPHEKIDLEFEKKIMTEGKSAIKGMKRSKFFLRFLFK